jgi:hypothetical protein
MTTHAMIDIETLSTDPDGQILTIGGVKFDPFSTEPTHSHFYYRFDIDEQEAAGRTQSESTLEWWGRQSDAAQEESFNPVDRTDCQTILQALKKWYVGCDAVWSHGQMDIEMLQHMCGQYDMPYPWAFYQIENSRTLINRMARDPRKDITFVAHHALEDCKVQVTALRQTLSHFGMTK